jgi:hypothetical protein
MLMPEDNHWPDRLTCLSLSLHKGLIFHTKAGELMLAQAQKSYSALPLPHKDFSWYFTYVGSACVTQAQCTDDFH